MALYRLAPMSTGIALLSAVLLLLPVMLLAIALTYSFPLLLPALLLGLVYAWIWLWYRPTAFVIGDDCVEVRWPVRRVSISRSSIREARLLDAAALQREIGWGMRIGAGGLWGGFGWLWTQRRGIVQMYISRTTQLVWLERGGERPWLITPERPQEFVRRLQRTAALPFP